MKRSQKLQKPLRQVALRIKCHGRTVHLKALQGNVAERKSGHRWLAPEPKCEGEGIFFFEAKTLHSEMALSGGHGG